MSQSLTPVNPNSPPLRIRASTYNRIAAAVNQVNATTFGARSAQGGAPAGPEAVVLVRNDTGATLDRFDAVALDGPLVDPADNASQFTARVAFSAAAPDPDKPVAICQQPIKAGKIGPAAVAGVSICKIDVAVEAHGYAVAETGSAILASASLGPVEILWKAAGTGPQWAVVRLGAERTPPNDEIRGGKILEMYADDGTVIPSPSITAGMGYPVYAKVRTDADDGDEHIVLNFATANVPNWGRHFDDAERLYFVSLSGLIDGNPVDWAHGNVNGHPITGFRVLPETPPQQHQAFAVQVWQNGSQYDLFPLGGGDLLGTVGSAPGEGTGLAYYDDLGEIQLWEPL